LPGGGVRRIPGVCLGHRDLRGLQDLVMGRAELEVPSTPAIATTPKLRLI